jgi:hypothetical protein
MSLLDLVRRDVIRRDTPATPATLATVRAATPETVATVATVAGGSRRNRVVQQGVEAKVDELRRLLSALLWDAPEEVEPEVQRAIRDDAVDETLAMYRRCHEDYTRIGELLRARP